MEYYLQAVVVGVYKYVLIEFHHLLFVASEEVHLYSCYSIVFHPFHLTLACVRCVHAVSGPLWCVVPVAVGVVP